jgi:hypothetical protein
VATGRNTARAGEDGVEVIFDACPRCVFGRIHALLVPADPDRPCLVLALPPTATALSDAIGGGLLDDAVYATVNNLGYCVYLDERRHPLGLPGNRRAALLATHLEWLALAWQVGLRGDALVAGVDRDGNDTDVPLAVVGVAGVTGLLSVSF